MVGYVVVAMRDGGLCCGGHEGWWVMLWWP